MKQEKKQRKEKGITLVALVITIIILLILAGVTLNTALSENGLFKMAKKATEEYIKSSKKEEEDLKNIEDFLLKENIRWTYNHETQTVTNGIDTINVGDYIHYNHKGQYSYTSEQVKNGYKAQTFNANEYEGEWRVLGADENGQLLVISDGNAIDKYSLGLESANDLQPSQNAYLNAKEELDKICEIYGHGVGATGARSVTVEDINTITGYVPEEAKYQEGKIREYKNIVTFKLDDNDGYVYYKGSKNNKEYVKGSGDFNSFTYYTGSEWRSLKRGEDVEIEGTFYIYYPSTLTDVGTNKVIGIEKNSTLYDMLFANTPDLQEGEGDSYWLASSYRYINPEGRCAFGFRSVFSEGVNGDALFNSQGVPRNKDRGIRPVVSLRSDIKLKMTTEEKGNDCEVYEIVE